MKKTAIFVDTNAILDLKYENFRFFEVKRYLFDLASFIKSKSLSHVRILLPKVVFEDLKYHQHETYKQVVSKLRSTYERFKEIDGFSLSIPDLNYENHLEKKGVAFLGKYNIELFDTPKKDLTSKLIERVLRRRKPFYKKQSDKDAGFKDAIIWESILDFAERNPDYDVILWTDDSDFTSEDLSQEFKEVSNCKFQIFNSSSDIEAYLDAEYKLDEKLSELIKSITFDNFNMPIIKGIFEKYKSIRSQGNILYIEDFEVKGIGSISYNKSSKIYSIGVELVVIHEMPYIDYGLMSSSYPPPDHGYTEISVEVKLSFENSEIKILSATDLSGYLE